MSQIDAALKPRSLLLATDFSEPSEKALRYSLALARLFKSKFCLAHVVSSLGLTMGGPGAIAVAEEAALRDISQLQSQLVRTGNLNDLQYKFIVQRGELWPELRETIRAENTDLLIVGTHARHGIAKLFFGSAAEQIYRQAACPVLTLGPRSDDRPWFESSIKQPTFLFATDFGNASLHGLPQTIEAANQFGAKLALVSIVPTAREEVREIRQQDRRSRTLERLSQLADTAGLELKPDLYVESGAEWPVSDKILEVADKLGADLIIMGLRESAYIGVISHLDLTTTYDVICRANSPVLTVNFSLEDELRSRLSEVTVSPLTEAEAG